MISPPNHPHRPCRRRQLVKLVNEVLVGCGFAAIAEAAAMVRAANLLPDRVLAALSGGRADSALLHGTTQ